MAGAYDRYDPLSGVYTPADLQLTNQAAAAVASSVTASSYTKIVDLPLVKYKKYKFQAAYMYKDEKTGGEIQGDLSPWLETTFDIPNNTKPVLNLVLTPGIKSYGIKFDFQAGSEHEDVIVYESLTGAFAGEQYIVYVGTANSMSINTSDFAPRWVKVVTRDRWLDTNISSASAGPVTPQNADPDTSTSPSAPSGVSVTGSIDAYDKSGFSGKIDVSWTANIDANTAGYVLRWSTQNPATTLNPIWEYGQVEGKATNKFSVTGLLPNTLYYYQVTAKSPYNALSWTSSQSGTFGPIFDSTAPGDAWAQLRSILSIGGKTADLFKIGTGIEQSINTSTTTTQSQVSGTYSGIILNKSTTNYGHNYWLNTGQFRVGSASSFLYWDGSDVYTTGEINATGGKFTGDVGVTTGSLYAGSSPTSGARVRLNSAGLFAYDTSGVQTISISQADGKIDARKGYIGGWTIDGTAQTTGSIYSSNTKLESNGNLTIGDTSGTLASIVKLSANDSLYRIWVGSQTAANAPFRVTKEGKLYASGAVFTGSTIDGYTTSASLATTLSGYATTTALGTKNATFAQATAPTATKVGDLWIDTANGNILKTWTGSVWTQRTDTTYATKTALDTKLEAGGYLIANPGSTQVTGINSNGITITSEGFKIALGTPVAGSNMVILNSQGIAAYNSTGATLFSINSSGNAVFKGDITGASGTFSGRLSSNVTEPATSSYFDSQGSLGGVSQGLVIGAIGFKNTSVGGWTSHCYPYMPGSPNIDLGTTQFRWNDTRISGRIFVGHAGSDTVTNVTNQAPFTVLYPNGRIYANTLSTGTGTAIIQDSSGFLRVSSSSRRYKENISEINNEGYLDVISQLKPVKFSYKSVEEDESLPGYDPVKPLISGLIAEDVEQIELLKDLVNYNSEGMVEGLSYDRLTAILVLAIQDMSNKLDSISNRLDALEG
jgi:hypothetical protein